MHRSVIAVMLLLFLYCALITASIIPATPTFAVAAPVPPIITAHSHQVIARQHNRLYVPTVPVVPSVKAVPAVTAVHSLPTYPSYSYATTTTYPNVYRYGAYPYGGYPYGSYSYSSYPYQSYYPSYGYGYGGVLW